MRKDFFVITHTIPLADIAKEANLSHLQVQTIITDAMQLVKIYEKNKKLFNADISIQDNFSGYEIRFSFKSYQAYKDHENTVDALVQYISNPSGDCLQANELKVMNYDTFLDKFILNFTLQNSLNDNKVHTRKTKI